MTRVPTDYVHKYDDNHPVGVNLSTYRFWTNSPQGHNLTDGELEAGRYPIADFITHDWYPNSGYPRAASTTYCEPDDVQGAHDLYAVACRNIEKQTMGLTPLGVYIETAYGYNSGIEQTPSDMRMTAFMSLIEQDARLMRWYNVDSKNLANSGFSYLWTNASNTNALRAKMRELTTLFTDLAPVIMRPAVDLSLTGGTSSTTMNPDTWQWNVVTPRCRAIRKDYNGKSYVFVYNRDRSNAAAVTVDSGVGIGAIADYEGHLTATPSGTSFSVTLPAAAGAVFEITPGGGTPPDATPPTVAITAPVGGSTVSGSVALAATAADNVGVSKVEFRADGVLLGTDTTAPYTGTWDATTASVGSHTIQARAIDAAGNLANIGVTVNVPEPPDATPPTAPMLTAVPGDAAVTLTWNAAPDAWTTRILRSTTGFATSPDDPSQQPVYEGVTSFFSDTSVLNDTTYYYTAFSSDAAGNWSIGSTVTATPGLAFSILLSTSASTVTVNKYATLTGEYFDSGIVGSAPSSVSVWSNANGAWKQIGNAAYSSRNKAYSYKTRITKTTSFQFRTSGSSVRLSVVSNTLQIAAKSTVALRSSTKVLSYGSRAKVAGVVNADSPTSVKIYRYAYNSSTKKWMYKGAVTPGVTARTSTYATFSATVALPRRGTWKLVAKHSAAGTTTQSKSAYRRVR
jgi:hypothetical protein